MRRRQVRRPSVPWGVPSLSRPAAGAAPEDRANPADTWSDQASEVWGVWEEGPEDRPGQAREAPGNEKGSSGRDGGGGPSGAVTCCRVQDIDKGRGCQKGPPTLQTCGMVTGAHKKERQGAGLGGNQPQARELPPCRLGRITALCEGVKRPTHQGHARKTTRAGAK